MLDVGKPVRPEMAEAESYDARCDKAKRTGAYDIKSVRDYSLITYP
jgi:hypothetical protein